MGDVISKIPNQFNADGTVKLTANLLTQYHRITLKNVQRASIARYNNSDDKRHFYKKVHSSVVARLIKNIFLVKGYDDLLLQQDKFAFYNDAIGEM